MQSDIYSRPSKIITYHYTCGLAGNVGMKYRFMPTFKLMSSSPYSKTHVHPNILKMAYDLFISILISQDSP